MKPLFVSMFIFLTLFCKGQAYVEISENGMEAYHDILSLKFSNAEFLLSGEKENHPNNVYTTYLENYIDFLTVFISEEETLFDQLEDNKSKRIDQIKQLDKDSPYRDYFLGNIHLQWAVARLKFDEYFTAAVEINKAYRLLNDNNEKFPDFTANKISLGVLHIMIGMVPDKYRWFLNLINLKGSVEQGRTELKFVLENTNTADTLFYLRNETLFYLGFIDLNIKPDPAQLDYLVKELQKSNNENLLHFYLSTNILMRTGQNDEALKLLNLEKDWSAYYPFYYLDYLRGECYLRKLDTENAKKSFDIFLDDFKGKNYIKDANRKIGWCYLINGEMDLYIDQMVVTHQSGHENVDVDKEAEKESVSELIPNVDLIKARLLFDGGYYEKTDRLLINLDFNNMNTEEKVERIYRLGRSADKQNKTQQAIDYYGQSIESGRDLKRYFAGNAALKLAELYEREGRSEKAIFYYQSCLDLDFDEYESSIHSKAKVGLKRLTD